MNESFSRAGLTKIQRADRDLQALFVLAEAERNDAVGKSEYDLVNRVGLYFALIAKRGIEGSVSGPSEQTSILKSQFC